MAISSSAIDLPLIQAWLHARSVGRELPLPVPDHGGLRVDTGQAQERMRYVFAEPVAGLAALAARIEQPRVFLKLCGSARQLAEHLPPRWQLQPMRWVMQSLSAAAPCCTLPAGYRLERSAQGPVWTVAILRGGDVAASGYAIAAAGVFVYDRIAVAPAHRRRGLGRCLMQALGSTHRAPDPQILVATDEGRALYRALGWQVLSPFATAVIPG